MDDPAAHFLPSLKQGGENMFYVGPQDLAPELEQLFTFPNNVLRKRPDQGQHDDRQSKRPRMDAPPAEEEEREDAEGVRRQSVLPSERGGDFSFDHDDQGFLAGPVDDMPLPEDAPFDFETDKRRMRTPSVAPSVTETIARQIQQERSSGGHTLAMFEREARDDAQSQSQAQTTPSKSVISEPISKTSSGFSKNTGMAMGLLRREIEAIEEEDKVVGFDQLADKVRPPCEC